MVVATWLVLIKNLQLLVGCNLCHSSFLGPSFLASSPTCSMQLGLLRADFFLSGNFDMTTLVNTGRFIQALMDWDLEAENYALPLPIL